MKSEDWTKLFPNVYSGPSFLSSVVKLHDDCKFTCLLCADAVQIVQCEKYLVWLEGYIPYLDTYNGRTIRYPDLLIRPNNTIKVDLEENKIVEFIKFDVENVVTVSGDRRKKQRACWCDQGSFFFLSTHKGSFETIHIQDSTGHEFTTRLGNVFTIGK